MNKQKSFIILTPGFASSEDDSTCLPMQQAFVKTIRKIFPEPKVYILAFQYPYRKDRYSCCASTVYSFDGRNRGGLRGLLLRREVSAVLQKLHEQTEIIGLLSFWLGECARVGKSFSLRTGVPHYCWLLGQDARVGNRHAEKLKWRAHELIALSDFLRSEWQRNYGLRPAHVVPPGIEEKQSILPTATRDIDILGVGSLIPLKRYDIFLNIIASLKNNFPQIKAVLVGDGPERKRLETLADKLDIKSNVNFAGEVSYGEVWQWMQRSKLLIHPSSYEGFSGVCQEALASGMHVISFCRAMNEEIPHWHIVSDEEEMICKAEELLSGDIDYSSQSPYTMNDTVRKMIALFLPSLRGTSNHEDSKALRHTK